MGEPEGRAGPQPIVQLRYEDEDGTWFAYIRHLAEGALFIPSTRPMGPGTEVRVVFSAPRTRTSTSRSDG